MSAIRTMLPLPKNIFHCLLHRAGYTHTVLLVQCQPLSSYIKRYAFLKKKKKFLQTCINLQSYNARFFLHFLFLCQTKYWLCYNALREYVTKIIHSTRSVQNIPNLSNEAFVFTCIQRCTHGNGDQGSSGIAVEWIILLPVQHGNIKLIFYFKQWHLLDHFN